MITGSHVIVYSRNAEADRAFLRDILELPHVDVGSGWLIFALPPSEVAFHPTDGAETQEFYLMCADINAFVQSMRAHSLACSPVRDVRWGLLTHLTLPGGGKLGVYQPRHARPTFTDDTSAQRKRSGKARRVARAITPGRPARR